jgi:hypothetical protein
VSVNSLSVGQILTMLAEQPGRVAVLTDGLTSAELRTAPEQGEWPADDVLAHLRSYDGVRAAAS